MSQGERHEHEPPPPEPTPHKDGVAVFEEGEEVAPPGVFVMSIVRWSVVLVMAAAAGASLLYVYGGHESAHGGVHAARYFCPMHPSVVQDQPGDCPICNMTLVLRPEGPRPGAPSSSMDNQAEPARSEPAAPPGLQPIELSAERVQLMGKRTARVRREALAPELSVVGVVAPTESALSSVQTRFSGWVQELHVTATGQPVKRGQLLARIYSPDLLAAQQELLNAKSWSRTGGGAGLGEQAALLDNARRRLLLLGMDPSELTEVERTGQPHRLIEVRAPARGYVADKTALLGLYVQPGTELFRIADLARVWVLIEVFERDAARLYVGQEASVVLSAYPGETFRGKLTLVYPVLSAETRTLRARVELNNPDLLLKPGMFGTVVLSAPGTEHVAKVLVIPREALIDMGEHQYVFVETLPGHFEPRVVHVGTRAGDSVQIVSGLAEDETVVTTGNFLLDSESRLRSASTGHGAR